MNRAPSFSAFTQLRIESPLELTVLWLRFCGGRRGTFLSGENVPRGLLVHGAARVSLHQRSHPHPGQLKRVEATARENIEESRLTFPLTPKKKAEQFVNDSYASGDMLYCTFSQPYCREQSKGHVKHKENTVLHTLWKLVLKVRKRFQ